MDPDGPHKAAVLAQVKPFMDAEIAASIVVGLYDAGGREIYGFGAGPGGKPPDGKTLYEIGSVTKVYTSLLFADAIQKAEVELDTPLAELLPPGVTAPKKDGVAIRLVNLSLHNSGLPRIPPTIAKAKDLLDPYAKYGENELYADLVHTELNVPPGEVVAYSNFGAGILGFVLGKKLGGGYQKELTDRVLTPLGLADTTFGFPSGAQARRAPGTNDDLVAVPNWRFDALAGAGALVSTARDQLTLIDAELDAASGGTTTLRRAMKLTQEARLEGGMTNEGLGWQIDQFGRHWHNGGTGGYHAYVGFDTKTRRGVVVLASTSSPLIDRLGDTLYHVMAKDVKDPAKLAMGADLAKFAGRYKLQGEEPIAIEAMGNRLYIVGEGEPKRRLVPISDHEFWMDEFQAVAVFEENRIVFVIGENRLVAEREAAAPPPAP